MELNDALFGAVLGALGGLWLGIVVVQKWGVGPLAESRDLWRTLAEDAIASLKLSTASHEESVELSEKLWRQSFSEQVAWAGKWERADRERRQLRARLAAALWSNRQLKHACRLDNQLDWKVNELARKVQSWDGE